MCWIWICLFRLQCYKSVDLESLADWSTKVLCFLRGIRYIMADRQYSNNIETLKFIELDFFVFREAS
jgi:hypothetical protein